MRTLKRRDSGRWQCRYFRPRPVGLCATIGARLVGAGLIVAVQSKPDRQKLAMQLGADAVIDPSAGKAVEEIIEMTMLRCCDALAGASIATICAAFQAILEVAGSPS
jgi:threonine dehydrogenase-like Zn-dependent dehydrogenase